MIRYRVPFLLVLCANFLIVITEDAQLTAEEKISNPKPPDKLILQKSRPYSQNDGLIESITNWIKNPLGSSDEKKSSEDLSASAAEYVGLKYLPPPGNYRGHPRSCYDCNSEPWIPIAGRSLHFPPHANNFEEALHHNNRPYFKEKHPHGNNKQFSFHHPPIDQYGAPQGSFDFPPIGEVVDFMLPPPYRSGSIISGAEHVVYSARTPTYTAPRPARPHYGTPQTTYGPPKPFAFGNNLSPPAFHQKLPPPSVHYGTPLSDISPPPLRYGVPSAPSPTPSRNYEPSTYRAPQRTQIPTTHLRPVSQDFQPPLPGGGIHTLPLENHLPPAMPSDSYGRPISDNVRPSNSYEAPFTNGGHQGGYVEPITSGSGDSDDYGKQVAFSSPNHFLNFASQQSAEIKSSLYQKGLTDVQVVPSVRIADYTASIEHPINLIQSPIFDLNVKGQESISTQTSYANSGDFKLPQSTHSYESQHKLSENPIIVDDTYTSASNINSTYSSNDNSTFEIKRHNDKFLSSEAFGDAEAQRSKEIDVTDSLIQQLILEHNIIEDPKTQIVGIQKTTIDPQKVRTNLNVVRPSMDYSSWTPTGGSSLPTVMVPPRQSFSTWLRPVNETFVPAKQPKKLQIIVPYLKKTANDLQPPQQPTAVYNREYTTLAPVFVPPPLTTESADLWTQFVEGIRTVQEHKKPAHGFSKPESTTEIYNIKDFLARQQNLHAPSTKLPYDIISLQRNIDDWTHQAYSDRHHLRSTKLARVKEIPEEYFSTTPGYSDNTIASDFKDHIASGSDKKTFISEEIADNLILPEDITTTSTEKPVQTSTVAQVRFIVRQTKPSWETNKVTLSNSTHEKVYVVTPQSYNQFVTSTPATAFSMAPRIQNGRVNNASTMTKISVRVEAIDDKGSGKGLKPVRVVYSEWPHLINDLATTTTTQRPTSRHPLFGLMDLAPYTAPPNSMVETIGGHSKVSNVATSPLTKYSATTPMPGTNQNQTVKIPAVN